MNYKNSITHNINTIKNMNQLNSSYKKLEKVIYIDRLKIFANRNWKKISKTNTNYTELFNDLLKRETLKLEKANEKEIDNIIDNTLKKFNYKKVLHFLQIEI